MHNQEKQKLSRSSISFAVALKRNFDAKWIHLELKFLTNAIFKIIKSLHRVRNAYKLNYFCIFYCMRSIGYIHYSMSHSFIFTSIRKAMLIQGAFFEITNLNKDICKSIQVVSMILKMCRSLILNYLLLTVKEKKNPSSCRSKTFFLQLLKKIMKQGAFGKLSTLNKGECNILQLDCMMHGISRRNVMKTKQCNKSAKRNGENVFEVGSPAVYSIPCLNSYEKNEVQLPRNTALRLSSWVTCLNGIAQWKTGEGSNSQNDRMTFVDGYKNRTTTQRHRQEKNRGRRKRQTKME